MSSEEKNVNFEEKVIKAKELLEKLTNPEITLGESVKLYKDGLAQIEEAQKLLEEAKLVFTQVNK